MSMYVRRRRTFQTAHVHRTCTVRSRFNALLGKEIRALHRTCGLLPILMRLVREITILYPWCANGVRNAHVSYEKLCMPGVRFISESSVVDCHNPIKDSHLLEWEMLAHAASVLYLERRLEALVIAVQVRLKSHSREVVTMHDKLNIPQRMAKAAWTSKAGYEPHIL